MDNSQTVEVVEIEEYDEETNQSVDNFEPLEEPKKEKNVLWRILALLLAVAPVALLCLLPFPWYVKSGNGFRPCTFLAIIGYLLSSEEAPLFGIIPILNGTETLHDVVSSLGVYVLALALVLNVIFGLIGLFSGKSAKKMAALVGFMDTLVFGVYAVILNCLSWRFIAWSWLRYAPLPSPLEWMPLLTLYAAFLGSFIFYFIFSAVKAGKKVWLNLLLCLLAIGFYGLFTYWYVYGGLRNILWQVRADNNPVPFLPSMNASDFYHTLLLVSCGLTVFGIFFSFIRLSAKKRVVFELLRSIFHLLFGGAMIALTFLQPELEGEFLFPAIAAGIGLARIILCILVLHEKREIVEKEDDNVAEEFYIEPETCSPAVAEKVASDEPVAEEKQFEEVAANEQSVEQPAYGEPAPAAQPNAFEQPAYGESAQPAQPNAFAQSASQSAAQPSYNEPAQQAGNAPAQSYAQPASPSQPFAQRQPAQQPFNANGNDYFASKNFDPFLASLTNEERQQFTEIFILKYFGENKGLPEYVVGENNDGFFRQIFIHLGQYRSKIPNKLLAKMYRFTISK